MSFAEIRFPDDISYGSSGGPEYATDIVLTQSGHEQRNANWSEARARYNVAHGVKTKAQLDALIAFFRARKGRAQGFRFKDWSDYTLTDQVIATADGVAQEFAIIKGYSDGIATEQRRITKPVANTFSLALDGVAQSNGWSVNSASGTVVFDAPPPSGVVVSVSGEFDVPVRFDTDRLSATLDDYGVHSWLDIPLIEVRV